LLREFNREVRKGLRKVRKVVVFSFAKRAFLNFAKKLCGLCGKENGPNKNI